MQRNKFVRLKRRQAISPIVATLLLILIAIATGVILYSYVLGFLANSTQNTGFGQSTISIPNSCLSTTTHCQGTNYLFVIQNLGSETIAAGTLQVYLTDIATGATATLSLPYQSTAPGGSITETGSYPTFSGTAPNAGDTITVKIVMSDGGAASSSLKLLS